MMIAQSCSRVTFGGRATSVRGATTSRTTNNTPTTVSWRRAAGAARRRRRASIPMVRWVLLLLLLFLGTPAACTAQEQQEQQHHEEQQQQQEVEQHQQQNENHQQHQQQEPHPEQQQQQSADVNNPPPPRDNIIPCDCTAAVEKEQKAWARQQRAEKLMQFDTTQKEKKQLLQQLEQQQVAGRQLEQQLQQHSQELEQARNELRLAQDKLTEAQEEVKETQLALERAKDQNMQLIADKATQLRDHRQAVEALEQDHAAELHTLQLQKQEVETQKLASCSPLPDAERQDLRGQIKQLRLELRHWQVRQEQRREQEPVFFEPGQLWLDQQQLLSKWLPPGVLDAAARVTARLWTKVMGFLSNKKDDDDKAKTSIKG